MVIMTESAATTPELRRVVRYIFRDAVTFVTEAGRLTVSRLQTAGRDAIEVVAPRYLCLTAGDITSGQLREQTKR